MIRVEIATNCWRSALYINLHIKDYYIINIMTLCDNTRTYDIEQQEQSPFPCGQLCKCFWHETQSTPPPQHSSGDIAIE